MVLRLIVFPESVHGLSQFARSEVGIERL